MKKVRKEISYYTFIMYLLAMVLAIVHVGTNKEASFLNKSAIFSWSSESEQEMRISFMKKGHSTNHQSDEDLHHHHSSYKKVWNLFPVYGTARNNNSNKSVISIQSYKR